MKITLGLGLIIIGYVLLVKSGHFVPLTFPFVTLINTFFCICVISIPKL